MSEEIYKQQIIDRYHDPRYKGELDRVSIDASESNPLCGDWVRFQLHVENERITQVVWQGEGCAISLAAADLLAEKISGMTLGEAANISEDDVLNTLGIELKPSRMKCALLGLGCVKKGLGSSK